MTAPTITADALSRHVGQTVKVQGIYQADFAPAHKVLVMVPDGKITKAGIVALLSLEGGVFVDLFDRPEAEARRFNGGKVIVTGELCAPDTTGPSPGEGDLAAAHPLYHLIHISGIEPVP